MPTPALDPKIVGEIQGMILRGMRQETIANEMGVSRSSVSRAKAKISSELLLQMKSEERDMISDLVMQQLEMGIEASIEIASQAKDPEWRKTQRAGELATFYGVITDKTIRLYEASENAAIALAQSLEAASQDYTSEIEQ
ncbi:MAG: hypothetical protein WBP82_09170 [Leuconostoc mesenteroides]